MGEHLGELSTGAAITLLNAHAARAEQLEHRAAREASAPVRTSAKSLLVWSTQQWVARFGALSATPNPLEWSGLAVDIAARMVAPMPGSIVLTRAQEALVLGLAQGAVEIGLAAPDLPVLARSTRNLALGTTAAVARRYEAAKRLLHTAEPERHLDLVTALAPTQAAAGDVDRDARYATNAAVNQGLHAVAEHHDAALLWMAERDACVVCLALAGSVVEHGESFDESATFGDWPSNWWTPPGEDGPLRPPRHPRCRCRVEPWLGGSDLPAALRREAERSILRGERRPSESEGLRIRAADRLLRRGTDLPKTVQYRARRAIKARSFAAAAPPPDTHRSPRARKAA